MSGPFYLAWRYLAYHRFKTAILITSISLIAFLPTGLNVLAAEGAAELTTRAEGTPLVVGARGSALELVLSALYFDSAPPAPTRYAEVERIAQSGLAASIPLHVRFRARGHPIVGTTLEYLDFRGLRIASGRRMAVLGECVLGASAARRLGLAPSDSLVSSPETVFDLAGVYPLRMKVVGVLAPAYSPDDEAVFVDLKTAWIIEGLGHGHQDLARPEAESAVLTREGGRITANASLAEYNEITAENIDTFHFHGELSEHPVHAVIAVPRDEKSGVLLRGRYEGRDEAVQMARPAAVMGDLLDTVLTVKAYVVAVVGVVGLAALATAALVFLLSLRLRRREIDTMIKIGGSRSHVAAVLVSEVVGVLLAGSLVAGGLTLLVSQFGGLVIRIFLQS